MFIILLLISIISIIFFGLNIDTNMNEIFLKVSWKHLLGTDNLGRDILSSIIYGLWFSIFISTTIIVLSSFIGIIIGIIIGYFEGFLETIFLRIGDVLLAFPSFLFILLLLSVFGNGLLIMIFAITFLSWVEYARIIRGEVLKYKNTDFVIAAKAYNASSPRIILTHIFPHLFPVLLVQIPIHISNVILIESSLSFLGLGTDPQIPTLGQLVFNGQAYIFQNPGLIIFPGLVLFGLILAINFIGEGLRLNRKNS